MLDYCNTHRLVTIYVASQNPMNGDIGEKEGINVRENRKRGKEYTNCKERGRFGDSWYFFC